MRDWGTSHLVDDLFAAAPQYTQPSWNFRSIFQAMDVSPYPLGTSVLPDQTLLTRQIAPLATAHFLFSVTPGATGTIRWSGPGGGTIAAAMQWSIVRLD
jgi:hypothetical protein